MHWRSAYASCARPGSVWCVRVLVLLAGCGRLAFDDVAASDASVVSIDAPVDAAPRLCQAGTLETEAESAVCIELLEREPETWVDASMRCAMAGRRLCADAEWFAGCQRVEVMGMTNAWEWLAEESQQMASKRGAGSCEATSSDVITSVYSFRCCVEK